ncbi:methyltransferase domain-containing protein [Chitinispirillales bacterium ANBcel5]|uniref:class I SAM-dependent methyltransferase n=1 Tax=Cellulosispirillum alkaliphilum TaxID=3039283 RepID=UPI002A509CE1|nr:methyltransferase domain-containing protein [Chitinispirillales bacterium ANBcel5]
MYISLKRRYIQNIFLYLLKTMNLQFKTKEFSLESSSGSGRTFRFVRPSNPTDVLETITDEQYEKDHFLPYWAETWPSSTVLFEYLTSTLKSSTIKIIEPGCGLGHLSSVLASLGHCVTAMDISPVGCKYALHNIRNNSSGGQVVCCDWRSLPFKKGYADLLVASDILYEKRWIKPVLSVVKNTVKKEGKALIADPCRTHWEDFKREASGKGFNTNVVHTGTVNSGKIVVEILEIRR